MLSKYLCGPSIQLQQREIMAIAVLQPQNSQNLVLALWDVYGTTLLSLRPWDRLHAKFPSKSNILTPPSVSKDFCTSFGSQGS